jgi:hypothetical protein
MVNHLLETSHPAANDFPGALHLGDNFNVRAGSRASVSAVSPFGYNYSELIVELEATTIVICFRYAYHPAGKPSAAGSSDEKCDIGLGGASSGKKPHVALEAGVALSAQGHESSIHHRGVHARGVADQSALDAGNWPRRPDEIPGRQHQAIDVKAQVPSGQVHFCAAIRYAPWRAPARNFTGAISDGVSGQNDPDDVAPLQLAVQTGSVHEIHSAKNYDAQQHEYGDAQSFLEEATICKTFHVPFLLFQM